MLILRRHHASMKCSSRRNYDDGASLNSVDGGGASMKCSPRRNCDLGRVLLVQGLPHASMKCSSRRNYDSTVRPWERWTVVAPQ